MIHSTNKMGGTSDSLIIGYDSTSGADITCLMVGRKQGRGLKVISIFYGDEAENLYKLLTKLESKEELRGI